MSRLPDVRAAARAADTMSSADGVTRLRMAGPLLVTMDGKRHSEMRRHVGPAFTKAAMESWQEMIDDLAARLVGEVLDNPGCDVVQRLAIPMPMLSSRTCWAFPTVTSMSSGVGRRPRCGRPMWT